MIELIFAIVVMALVLMSAPRLMHIASQSGYVALQQEGISQASSRINMIMAFPWDENDANESYDHPGILRVTGGDPDLDMNLATYRRNGTPDKASRTFKRNDGAILYATASLGKEPHENEDDIDDFTGQPPIHLHDYSAGTATTDYIEKTLDINISTSVYYTEDNVSGASRYQQSSILFTPFSTVSGQTTNIKMIEVTLTSNSTMDELAKNIVFRAFSCNVGSYKLEEKEF